MYNLNGAVLKKEQQVLLLPESSESSLPSKGQNFVISKKQISPQKCIIYLKNIQTRNEALEILPFSIWVDREDFPKVSSDEYYLVDLVGMPVKTSEGQDFGTVIGIYETEMEDPILTIQTMDGEEIDLPYIESFFPSKSSAKMAETCLVIIPPEFI